MAGAGFFIGLMSGTSLDGVDGVLAAADADGRLESRGHVHAGFPPALRAELLALNTRGGNDELHRAALAANALMACYADVAVQLAARSPQPVRAIGAHGQTVRHRPGEFDGRGYTTQLVNGALLSEMSGIDVICDFRSRDVAAGGQGAPLVPAFHAARFGVPGRALAVLNLGGIANLTLLPGDASPVIGFDCGPANVLIDGWAQRHLQRAYDADGAWAAGGRVDDRLLARLLAEPFFALPPPKSTGRDLFDTAWLDARLDATIAPQDVMATLAELTARGVAEALVRHASGTREVIVCGGGAHNRHLLRRIALLANVTVSSSAALGVAPDQVEALAFAWLAQAFLERTPGNLPAVTGARGARVLGALYPA